MCAGGLLESDEELEDETTPHDEEILRDVPFNLEMQARTGSGVLPNSDIDYLIWIRGPLAQTQ